MSHLLMRTHRGKVVQHFNRTTVKHGLLRGIPFMRKGHLVTSAITPHRRRRRHNHD